MEFQRKVAQAAWFFPTLLFLLSIHQAKVARDLDATLTNGTHAIAEVTDYQKSERADVTYDYVSLRIPMPDGTVMQRDKVSLPHTLVPRLEGQETLEVRVLAGAAQEVVITSIGATQTRIAVLNGVMSFGAFMMVLIGVYAWNRSLRKPEDEAPTPLTPVAQTA